MLRRNQPKLVLFQLSFLKNSLRDVHHSSYGGRTAVVHGLHVMDIEVHRVSILLSSLEMAFKSLKGPIFSFLNEFNHLFLVGWPYQFGNRAIFHHLSGRIKAEYFGQPGVHILDHTILNNVHPCQRLLHKGTKFQLTFPNSLLRFLPLADVPKNGLKHFSSCYFHYIGPDIYRYQ